MILLRPEPSYESEPPLRAHKPKEQPDSEARERRRPPVAGEDRDERAKHAWRRIFAEEQITKLRRVEGKHESPERDISLALATGESREACHGQITCGETLADRLRRFEPRFESNRHASGEHRIQKRARIPSHEPAIARIRARTE